MKCFVVILCLVLFDVGAVIAQDESYGANRQGSLSFVPLYQQWSIREDIRFAEITTLVSLVVPAGREWTFSLRGLPASVSGDITRLSAYTDTRLGLTYRLEKPDIVLSLSLNLPTGKKELTQDEFETSMLLSNSVFNLQVPNFGQGLNIRPGLVYAVPLSDEVVLGLAASYQYRGSYKTLANYDNYDPGDEVALTGGLDVRLEEATTVSADIIVTTFGTDRLGSDEVLSPSPRVVANAQFSKAFGSDEFSLFAQFVLKGASRFSVGNLMVDEVDKIEPNRLDFRGRYFTPVSERLRTAVVVEVRMYESSEASLAGKYMVGLGIEPELIVSKSLTVPCVIKYHSGALKDGRTLSSVSGGIGLRLKF